MLKQKQTILFFSREALTYLYGPLSNKFKDEYKIIHVAYSKKEEIILKSKFGINEVINLREEAIKLFEKEILDEKLILKIDQIFLKNTKGEFTLNSSLQSDRSFQKLEYKETLLMAQIYYKFWNNLFCENKVNFFIHEATSLFINHIASVLVKENGGYYLTEMQIQGETSADIIFVNQDGGIPIEIEKNYLKISDDEIFNNKKRIGDYALKNSETDTIFFDSEMKLNFNILKIIKNAFIEIIKKMKDKKKYNKIVDSIDIYCIDNLGSLKKIINLINYSLFLKYDIFNLTDKYYYYSLHLEPEATVLYWGKGWYKNQVKLIENIAAQIPPNTYLYVKDHPHIIGYRSIRDYLELKKIPNIKILNPKIPGKKIISNSEGVFTINGTAGFEGIMLDKNVYNFGETFYNVTYLCSYIRNIKDLRKVIYQKETIEKEERKREKERFILSILKSTYSADTACFYNFDNKNRHDEENLNKIYQAYNNYLKKISNWNE